LPFVVTWRKAERFFPALLPTQQTQQDNNMNFHYCEHPKIWTYYSCSAWLFGRWRYAPPKRRFLPVDVHNT
jgi:hypothetical protein